MGVQKCSTEKTRSYMLRRQHVEMRCAVVDLHVCQSRKMNHKLDLFDEIRQVTIYTVWNKYIDYLDGIHE